MITPPPSGHHRELRRTRAQRVRGNTDRTDRGHHRGEKKTCKIAHSHAVDPRAVFVVAVGNTQLAVDNLLRYRPQEIPANKLITGTAGDAGGILRGSGMVERRPGHPIPSS